MALDDDMIAHLAGILEAAELNARPVQKITDLHPDLSCQDAYAIQGEIRRRKEARGHGTIGLKAGLTSRAKMRQMGVAAPVFGFLSDYMSCADGGEIKVSQLIHPKVEAEIAFVTRAPLRGPGCHVGAVLAATDFVVPALEIIDSRYENFGFDAHSVIADNTSAARFVAGACLRDVTQLDLSTTGVVLEKNGVTAALGAGAAVLGHPAAALAMLANMLARSGAELPAGSYVMTGGITEAISVAPGDVVTARFQNLGAASVRFV